MVVIRNVLGGHLKIHKKYDLKGKTNINFRLKLLFDLAGRTEQGVLLIIFLFQVQQWTEKLARRRKPKIFQHSRSSDFNDSFVKKIYII